MYICILIYEIIATIKIGQEFNRVVTHRDESGIDENCAYPGKPEEALKCIKEWVPASRLVVELTPQETLLGWKLVSPISRENVEDRGHFLQGRLLLSRCGLSLSTSQRGLERLKSAWNGHLCEEHQCHKFRCPSGNRGMRLSSIGPSPEDPTTLCVKSRARAGS